MKTEKFNGATVTGYADVQGETIKVWADIGPRGGVLEVRSYCTQMLPNMEQVHHNDIFKKSEWSDFVLADLDPDRAGENANLPEWLKSKLGGDCE